jgi:hypothetical protein
MPIENNIQYVNEPAEIPKQVAEDTILERLFGGKSSKPAEDDALVFHRSDGKDSEFFLFTV